MRSRVEAAQVRPTRIEVQGFSAYRRSEIVDFEGVDFFSLTGPTGAGKSSLIDAMVFALYGRVPRLGGNAVAPAISAGSDRARVRLDFEVDGVVYTAARLAQRTASGGASVKEARLQMGDQVLADGADDVTAAVADLLKLTFEDFTRTVVLPQGEFARFLTATKSERQGLLRNLLGMDMYTRVRELAKTRSAVATERADGARRALEGLDVADEDRRAGAVVQRDRLVELAGAIPDRETALAELDATVVAAEDRIDALADAHARLSSIEIPERLDELDELVSRARASLVESGERREQAAETLTGLETSLGEMATMEQLVSWSRSRGRLRDITERLQDPDAALISETAEEAQVHLEQARSDLAEVRADLETARGDHSAHVLAATLSAGDSCPVCAQVVVTVPERGAPAALDALERAVVEAETRLEKASSMAHEASTALARSEALRAELSEQKTSLEAELSEVPDEESLARLQEETASFLKTYDEARSELTVRQEEEARARTALEDLADDSRHVSKLLTTAQLSVADLDPPVSESDDVVVQWKELAQWQAEAIDRISGETERARSAAVEAREAASAGRAEIVELLRSHEVETVEPYAVSVATALHAARSLVEAQEKAAHDARELEDRVKEASTEVAVADTLAGHLRSNGFEQWLMSGALNDLVSGANELLGQLSGGGYSLHSDESGSFSIVDHRNADEMRKVETLSGGETFLVSLALALSLAETLAAKGGAGLDAIILDEGFGTLDEESLDTVATVLEELTGRGLMVGIITHVKDLAARAPVRYEVTREVDGAAVRLAS